MARWIFPQEDEYTEILDPDLGLSELVGRLLADRGITDPELVKGFLDPAYYTPSPPGDLDGMGEAVSILRGAIKSGQRIGVWGDFDVDGQTATTLLVSALRKLGAEVVYHIPVRATESHGIKIEYLKEFLQEGISVLLTCDTGISEHEAIAFARQLGIRVVITDHHDLPDELPDADAIINPNMLPEGHPLKGLPGVGVAYKLVEEMYAEAGRSEEISEFLDLVALGIVADVADLAGDTRYLLQMGLKQLRLTTRLGLDALFKEAGLVKNKINEDDIGFSIAPRLNALGRLGDANGIVDFLTTDDVAHANVFANRLEGMNTQRKLLTSQILQGALSQLERDQALLRHAAIVLGNEHWPPGVIGIVASRLAERYNKPVVLLHFSEEGLARGSARSVVGCDIGEAIRSCKDLLINYGGHPMAAGLSLRLEDLDKFREKLSEEVVKQVGVTAEEPELKINLIVQLDDLSLPMIQDLDQLSPFGPGNPPLVFALRDMSLASHSVLGRTQDHRRLIIEDRSGATQSVLWWNGAEWDVPHGEFDLAFSARVNHFKGEVQLQVVLEDFRSKEEPPVQVDRAVEVFDYRSDEEPENRLRFLLGEFPQLQVWGEGKFRETNRIHGRSDLRPSGGLAIWSIPPSYRVLQEVLGSVKPDQIFLFANDPEIDELKPFLNRVAGLLKYALSNKSGRAKLLELAAAAAQTETVTRLGIAWWESQGAFSIVENENGLLEVSLQSSENLVSSPEALIEEIRLLLKETRLFREYFATSQIDSIQEAFGIFR